MRKSFKKAASLALVAVTALAMTACGSPSTSNDPTQQAGTTAEGTADKAVFKIGIIGPLSGDAAIYGQNVVNAAQIAVDEINAAGGVNGFMLEINGQDDENDPEKSVNAYNVVKDWGAQMILGCVTSGPCIAVTEKTKADSMFQLTPSGSAVECAKYANNFRVCFADPDQGAASARYIGENNLGTKVAVIYDSSTVYSTGIYESFVQGAASQNFEIVAAEAFTADNATDFSVQLQKAKDSGADLVFLPIYYQAASLILAQADGMGYAPTFFGVDGMDGILSVENFDKSLAEGVMLLTPFAADAKDELTVNFVTTYQQRHKDNIPNQFAADAYDGVYALKAALEKSGATPDMSVSDLCAALEKAMVEISVDGLTGAGITWNEAGEPNKEPKAVKIVDGVYVSMD
ncbi:MAG: ABC transporter substrate-binding protein [Alistipes sp.]|nr:ABC transporter substrate-binding protein [Alistipes sp.]